MSERTSYEPGTPSWIDLGSPDPVVAGRFYGELFGWAVVADPRPEAGGYAICTINDKAVGGLGPQQNPDMPPYWTVYISVDDADASIDAATAAGATVIVGAMDVLDAGRMGVLQDPTGSFISVWQPYEHIGAELVNETGTFTWNELSTGDLVAARSFYTVVFGWGVNLEASSETSTLFTLGGEVLCGAHAMEAGEFPAWSVWFAVEDVDASAEKVKALGGSVIVPPNDMGFGRGAVVADPHGAVFGIGAMGADPT